MTETPVAPSVLSWAAPAAEVTRRILAAAAAGQPLATRVGPRLLLLLDARVDSEGRDDGTPGTVLEVDPLLVASAPGAIEILRCRWEDETEEMPGGRLAALGLSFRRFRE